MAMSGLSNYFTIDFDNNFLKCRKPGLKITMFMYLHVYIMDILVLYMHKDIIILCDGDKKTIIKAERIQEAT